jgi:DNA-binding NtrC family response regulator
MKKAALPRIVYCGPEDAFFKKLSRYAIDFVLEARAANFNGSPQKLAQSRKASVLILKIKGEFELPHQQWLARNDASVPVVVISQNGTIQTAIQALQYGIHEYFCATQNLDVIVQKLHEALIWKSMKLARRQSDSSPELLHGKNPRILLLNEQARNLAAETKPVLLVGETGTGKEHLAYGMYRLGYRKIVPFMKYDCRLLQHVSAYDGRPVPDTIQTRLQEFKKKYSSGVLFLTHLEQLPADQQSEILERGGKSPIRLLVSCQESKPGLLDQTGVIPVPALKIPALRHRKDDIPILADHFVRTISRRRGVRLKALSEEILIMMQEYHWPGNVQEMANVIERMIAIEPSHVLSSGTWRICQGHTVQSRKDTTNQFALLLESVLQSSDGAWRQGHVYDSFMIQMEKVLIDLILPKVNHNQAVAARIMGISRNTLREKIKR